MSITPPTRSSRTAEFLGYGAAVGLIAVGAASAALAAGDVLSFMDATSDAPTVSIGLGGYLTAVAGLVGVGAGFAVRARGHAIAPAAGTFPKHHAALPPQEPTSAVPHQPTPPPYRQPYQQSAPAPPPAVVPPSDAGDTDRWWET